VRPPPQTQLDLEQRAHQSAVQKYVSVVEEVGHLKRDEGEKDAKLMECALAQAELIQQRDRIQQDFNSLEERCVWRGS